MKAWWRGGVVAWWRGVWEGEGVWEGATERGGGGATAKRKIQHGLSTGRAMTGRDGKGERREGWSSNIGTVVSQESSRDDREDNMALNAIGNK